jgi:hypothetical protein
MDLNVKLQGLKYNYEKVQGCFCKIPRFQRFLGFMELFSLRKIRRICPQHRGLGPPTLAHGSTNFIKCRPLAIGSTAQIKPIESVSRATVVGFRWDLLLRDHNDDRNVFTPTLISGERQRSLATVWRLGRCLSMVRAASGEASAPRTCTKASLSSILASWPTNCSDWRWKTWIWWLPRVRRVLDLRPKICTICGSIYMGF